MLPTLTTIKVMRYREMRTQGVGKAELARRLGWHLPQVDRVLDVPPNSRLDQLACFTFGCTFSVSDLVRWRAGGANHGTSLFLGFTRAGLGGL